MKFIPILRVNNLKESIAFYTNVLDFTLTNPSLGDDDWVVELAKDGAEILLSSIDGTPRIPVLLIVDDVDLLFEKYVQRGLVVPNNPDSPVHNGPVDQTWGLREFYVNDPGGNTIRFATPIVYSAEL